MDIDIPDALLAEWIDMSFGDNNVSVETSELDRQQIVDSDLNSGGGTSSSSTTSECAPAEPESNTIPATPSPSAAAAGPRRRRVKRVQLNAKQRGEICQLLAKIDMSKAAETIIAGAGGELHMSTYPERSSALLEYRSVWESVVKDLVLAYSQFYSECSSKSDKYSTFQMRWITNVFTFLDRPEIASCPLEDSLASSILHSLAAAVWRYCAVTVREYLRDAAVSNAGEISPTQLEEKHYWRFFGWAVHSSVKLLKRSASSAENEEELALLKSLQLQNKTEKEEFKSIPISMIMRDEGWMTFLRPQHLPFARNALDKVCSVVNHNGFHTYGKDFVQVVSQVICCDKTLHKPLLVSVTEAFPNRFSEGVVERVASRLISKVMNAMLGEVIETAEQIQLLSAGATTTSGLNLRDRLHPGNA